MSPESQTVRVNFARPVPLFPLDAVALFPHAVVPLHIFEERYKQMVMQALDGAGQIAMATFRDDRFADLEYAHSPAIRKTVCVGQIVQHERLSGGRYNILLQGVCRARIHEEEPPDAVRLYRHAILHPVGPPDINEDMLEDVRFRLRDVLSEPPLDQLSTAKGLAGCLKEGGAPTSAVLELIAIQLVNDMETKYQLLAEGDPRMRAEIIEDELGDLGELLRRASPQIDPDAPKGVFWN